MLIETPFDVAATIQRLGRAGCFRVDQPLGDRAYQVPMGHYALRLRASVPVIAQLGRADVRQPNLASYTTMGYGC